MVTRILNHEERQSFQWKAYPMAITENTTKWAIIDFLKKLLIPTKEVAFGTEPIHIHTTACDCIIIMKNGEKIFTRYNHIYKSNAIKIELNKKWVLWSQIKNKITTIVFMDSIDYHDSLKQYWSEKGFHWDLEAMQATRELIFNEIKSA